MIQCGAAGKDHVALLSCSINAYHSLPTSCCCLSRFATVVQLKNALLIKSYKDYNRMIFILQGRKLFLFNVEVSWQQRRSILFNVNDRTNTLSELKPFYLSKLACQLWMKALYSLKIRFSNSQHKCSIRDNSTPISHLIAIYKDFRILILV